MDDPQPPVMEYQRPQPATPHPTRAFIGGIVVGGFFTYASAVIGVIALVGAYYNTPAPLAANAVPFLGPAATIAVGLFLARRPERRPFGLGLAASVPLTAITVFIICGGLR